MDRELRRQIKDASERPGADNPEFLALLKLIDQHYDKEETTSGSLTRSMRSLPSAIAATPVEVIFDSVTDALLSVGSSGVIRNCNKVCARYFGLPRHLLIGSSISSILPSAGGHALAEYLQPFMTDLDDTHIEFCGGEVLAARTDGRTFIAEIHASSLVTPEDEVFVISLRDITGRKEAEKALRENEERYRALVENAPEAIVVLDVDSNCFCDANDNACQLFNLSRARLLSVGPQALSPKMQPDGQPSFGIRRGLIDRALNGEHPTFEWLHQNANGKEFPCEVRFSRLPSGDRKLIRVSITDITERKRNDELAFVQNKILEMIASSAPAERTLRSICRCVEKIADHMRAAIMQLDGDRQTLRLAAAPSLPEAMRERLQVVGVAEGITCAAAVLAGREKICEQVTDDAAWAAFAADAAEHRIGSAWSFPIFGAADDMIGTLDVYLKEARRPTTDELDKLSRMTGLAGIAIKRQRDEDQLRSSEARYRGLFENVVDGVYITSREGDIITVNPALVEMLGYDSPEEMTKAGRTTMLYVNPIDRERVFARLEAQGYLRNFEYRLKRKDGREIVVLENSRAIYDDDGNVVAHEGTITDITERKIAETRVFEEKERAQVTLQSIGDGVITTDAEGRVDYINPVAQELAGLEIRNARGKPIDKIMTIIHEHTRASVENPVLRCLKEGRVIALAENSVLINHHGIEIAIQDSAAPIRDRMGNIIGAVMVFHDVSKESRLFRQLSYQASHDALTGLINRREFENRLVAALDDAYERNGNVHALLYFDLDQFKVVNDTFGHTAGDELLRQISELVQSNIRSTDVLARLGGDEFGILLERCTEERAIEVAEAIRSAVETFRFTWQDACTSVRCSIGIVMVNKDSQSVATAMSSADVACYSAKDMGRNQVHLYQHSDASMRHEEMKWVSRITSAIEDNRFELYYQPIIGIGAKGLGVRGHYELLLRMRSDSGEIVGPDQFIPAAERYNLMSMLDRWVIREALSQLADRSHDSEQARFTLAINLSGTSLSEDRFLEFVIDELKRQRLPQGAICFEITETAAISNLSRVIHFMQTLRKLGCKFSLDDFGSGLSSFTYLKNLPVDYLKIDGQFIRNVAEDTVDESMVRAINEVGRAMGIATIAERVESKEVLDKLGDLGIEFAQGFFIARPTSVETFEPWASDVGAASRLA
jgi:diguanylate cyclase (GGDEF)-like protein/PAS domain S-box-containing protein